MAELLKVALPKTGNFFLTFRHVDICTCKYMFYRLLGEEKISGKKVETLVSVINPDLLEQASNKVEDLVVLDQGPVVLDLSRVQVKGMMAGMTVALVDHLVLGTKNHLVVAVVVVVDLGNLVVLDQGPVVLELRVQVKRMVAGMMVALVDHLVLAAKNRLEVTVVVVDLGNLVVLDQVEVILRNICSAWIVLDQF